MLTKCPIQAMQGLLLLALISLIISMSNQPLQAQSVQSSQRSHKLLSVQQNLYSPSMMQYQAGEDSTGIPKIQLKREFWGYKFIYDSNEPKSVYPFVGLTYEPECLYTPVLSERQKKHIHTTHFQQPGGLVCSYCLLRLLLIL